MCVNYHTLETRDARLDCVDVRECAQHAQPVEARTRIAFALRRNVAMPLKPLQ